MNKICRKCLHSQNWFENTKETSRESSTYASPFQEITDADTGDKQVFISKKNPCYGCKYIFEKDNYEEELKKCPFCGFSATLYVQTRGDNPGEDYVVCCSNNSCGIETGLYETKREAIAAWNRRV